VRRGMIIPQSGKTSASVHLGRHGSVRVYRLAPGIISGDVAKPGSSGDAAEESWVDRFMRDPP